jgi:hypothetical protein
MLFSELNQKCQAIPDWAEFLIHFGYRWRDERSPNRRIALVSMPCDSAGAGLVSLGSMTRDLANEKANDIDGHCDSLLRYAWQYLKRGHPRVQPPCDPQVIRSGDTTEVTGRMRWVKKPKSIYLISEATDFDRRKVAIVRNGVTVTRKSQFATEFYIDGEPEPQAENSHDELPAEPYRHIIADAEILPQNLRRTYSGLCLAGRAAGANASRETCSAVRFHDGTTKYGLEEILTVHGWSDRTVSRVSFFNSRTGEADRNAASASLVVADGDIAFLKALSRPCFQQSDIVGVINRAVDRDSLETIGNKMLGLRQWYEPDNTVLAGLPPATRGISVAILKRR